MTCVEIDEVTRTNATTRIALVMISGRPVPSDPSSTSSTVRRIEWVKDTASGGGDSPGQGFAIGLPM